MIAPGDGAMQMNGMAELITVAKDWEERASPRFVVLVLNNRDLNQVTWEQRAQAGDPKFMGSQSIPDISYTRFADLIGLRGIFVDNPDHVGRAWDEALTGDRPVVLEAYTDPNVPPLPPHITLAQARAFAGSIYGDPERGSVIQGHRARDDQYVDARQTLTPRSLATAMPKLPAELLLMVYETVVLDEPPPILTSSVVAAIPSSVVAWRPGSGQRSRTPTRRGR